MTQPARDTGTPHRPIDPPPVDVAIVNYNTRDMLRACLRSLAGHDALGTIRVADNGSHDGSLEMVTTEFPHVDLISLPHNPGFGAAANELIGRSTADTVVLLNADARLHAGALHTLGTYLATHPDVAVAGPRVVQEDGTLQRTVFDDPSVRELLWQESGLHRWRRGGLADFAHDTTRSVPWVLGAVMAIRRTAFDEVGGFDPGFFLYYEEVDLCVRLRAVGYETAFVADAEAIHHGGSSTAQHSRFAQLTHYRSLHRFHELHGTARSGSLRAAVVAIMAARSMRDAGRSVLGPADRRAAARADRTTWTAVMREALRGWPSDPSTMTATDASPTESTRRLDWLVLLPEPTTPVHNVTVLGGVDDHVAAALAAHFDVDGVERTVRRDIDVLVAHTDADDLDGGLDHLSDGGVAIVFGTRRAQSSPALARRVAEHGCTVVSRHWVVPGHESPRRYVPLDDRQAIRWYLDRLFIPGSRLERTARAVLRRATGLAARVARDHSLVAVRGPHRPSAIAALTTAAADDTGGVLVTTSGYDPGSRTIAMPFAGSSEPRCTVKVSAHVSMNETTRREFDTLVSLHDVLPSDLVATVPRPLELTTWHDRVVSRESMLHGPTLEVALRQETDPAKRVALLGAVTDWLTRLHEHTAEHVACDDAFVTTWFDEPFARYRDTFAPNPEVDALLDRALEAVRSAGETTMPIVRRHVDLGPWNIIVTSPHEAPVELGVIDWESAGHRPLDGRGLAYCDLDYFIKYWLHIVADATTPQREDHLFASLTPPPNELDPTLRAAPSEAIDRYRRHMRLDARHIAPLAVHNWVEQALYGADRAELLQRSHDAGPATRLVDALAARTDQLFDEHSDTSAPR